MKRYIVLSVLTILVCIILVGHAVGIQATSVIPGSADDPLVTKGYVDELIKKINANPVDDAKKDMAGSELIVVELFPGDVLKGKSGTEIIVRTGKVKIVAAENGIPDVTDGKDLAKGTVVPHNHLLIVPRDDGRGIESDRNSQEPVFVMVRGDYELIRTR